jgi:alpha-1,2-mannosyltransferase
MLANCKIGAYVHYPTISTVIISLFILQDMLQTVNDGVSNFNNDESISNSPIKTFVKLKYYQLFSKLYGFTGWFVDVCMVNSNWTKEHVKNV